MLYLSSSASEVRVHGPMVGTHGDGRHFTYFWMGRRLLAENPRRKQLTLLHRALALPCNTITSPL